MSADTCSPILELQSNTTRFWYIIFPVLCLILGGETFFVFMSIPDVLGSAKTMVGKLPAIPKNVA
jgi:hypothetical protein